MNGAVYAFGHAAVLAGLLAAGGIVGRIFLWCWWAVVARLVTEMEGQR